jgi:5-methylcytosine-specific restriction protein A
VKAPKVCAEPGCAQNSVDPRHGRCEVHTPKRWAQSTRADALDKKKWSIIRKRVLRRDHGICRFCQEAANTVDHRRPLAWGGEPYDPLNLQAMCQPCHDLKTKEEEKLGRALARGDADRTAINVHVARWS